MAPGQNGTLPRLTAETTRRQASSNFFGVSGVMGFNSLASYAGACDYQTYRKMSRDPTLALARAMAKLPILGASHSFEADDGVPDQVVETVQKAVDGIWGDLVEVLLWALEYGWKSGELIWENTAAGLVPVRFKPLAVDTTCILVDADTGSYLGVRQGDADLRWGKSVYFGNEVEDQNYYGVSRHENVRQLVWGPWQDLMTKLHTYFAKGAGVIPIVRYPIGEGADESGANDDNFKRARDISENLSAARGICYPTEISNAMIDAAIKGAKIDDMQAWTIDFLEARAGHGDEFLGSARYLDSLKMRGWLVPERAGIEGQNGTKAEAEVHGDVGVGVAEQTHQAICRAVSRQVVDPILVYNFGPQMRGKVRIVAAPMVDDARALVRDIVKSVLTNPAAIDVLLSSTDFDAMLDQTGIPKGEQVVDAAALLQGHGANAPADPNAPKPGPGGPPKPPAPKTPADQRKEIAASMERIHAALMRGGNGTRRTIIASDGPHKWACAYAPLPQPQAAAVLALGRRIPDDQLASDGRETEPHVTIKYGIGADDPEAVRAIVEASPPIKVVFGAASVFANDEYDVLKFDVWSDGLSRLNDAIDRAVPHVDTHDWYQPHATVAYLKPGTGQLYAGDKSLEGQEAVIDRVVFSDRAGRKTVMMLKGPTAPAPEADDPAPED